MAATHTLPPYPTQLFWMFSTHKYTKQDVVDRGFIAFPHKCQENSQGSNQRNKQHPWSVDKKAQLGY